MILLTGCVKFLTGHGHIGAEIDEKLFEVAADLVQTRIKVLGDAWDLLKFLFIKPDEFAIDEAAKQKNLGEAAVPVLRATVKALEGVSEWTADPIEEALKADLIDELGLKPNKAFAPVRVAVTGSHISPPLYQSLELLGREIAMDRLRAALSELS